MKPPVDHLRISSLGKDQLIKLKRQTGIEHWNILCRWALCVSLREKSHPPSIQAGSESGVEMSWKVFAGEHSDVFSGLIFQRARQEGVEFTPEELSQCLRAHIHRGLGYLASGKDARSIDQFLMHWLHRN